MDELAATCQACGPDTICIVESWLSSDTTDDGVSLPKYSTIRFDRNRHGGGIIVFLKNNLPFEVVMSGLLVWSLFLCLFYCLVTESFV